MSNYIIKIKELYLSDEPLSEHFIIDLNHDIDDSDVNIDNTVLIHTYYFQA